MLKYLLMTSVWSVELPLDGDPTLKEAGPPPEDEPVTPPPPCIPETGIPLEAMSTLAE